MEHTINQPKMFGHLADLVVRKTIELLLADDVCWEFLLKMGGVKVTVKFAK
jgi:hypothetical protein